MTDKAAEKPKDQPQEGAPRDLPPAARRALAEAEGRRKAQNAKSKPKELGGPKGEEPTRYGDWERNGRAVDF